MKKVYEIKITLLSALHINGGVDSASTRITVKQNDKAYIPATVFKGIVRDRFSALLSAITDNEAETATVAKDFFGAGGFCPSRTIFDNLITQQPIETELRANVSINRYTRKALDRALVFTEVQPPVDMNGQPVVFSGDMTVHYKNKQMQQYECVLTKAVESILCIGSGKSRGLGFVKISIGEKTSEPSGTNNHSEAYKGKRAVKFLLESDVITGGVRSEHDVNFLNSENVISGSVLRAAFANEILLDCPYASELYNGKANFVTYRNKESCKECKNVEVCKNFSNMIFSTLTIEGSLPAPFTSRICKTCGVRLMDTIAETGRLKCPDCQKKYPDDKSAGRMENAKGFINADGNSIIKPAHSISIHTAIDPYTSTARDGRLFSIKALKSGQIYTGIINDCGSGMLQKDSVVYVGKYSSNGFGKLRIIDISEAEERNIRNAVNDFNIRFGNALCKKYGEGKRFATILLISDAKLVISTKGITSSEEYKQIWQKAFFGEINTIKLEQIYTQTFTWTGYDTAIVPEDNGIRRKKTELITEKGTSLLISFTTDDAIDTLAEMEICGVGKDTNIGYGQLMICSKLHNLGIETEEKL